MSENNAQVSEEGPVWPWALGLMLVGLIAFVVATAIHSRNAIVIEDQPPVERLDAEPVLDRPVVGEGDRVLISFSDFGTTLAAAA